jgi:hypothetical protein
MSVEGSGISYVSDVLTSTTTDNVAILELLGSPICSSAVQIRQEAISGALIKAIKPTKSLQIKANIKWDVQIFCGSKLDPDIHVNIPQVVQCL